MAEAYDPGNPLERALYTERYHSAELSKEIVRLRAEVADKDRIIEDLEYQVQALTPVGEG